MEKSRPVPRQEPQGMEKPKGMVEVRREITSTGKVLQEFLPAKKKRGGSRRGNR